MSRCFFGSTGRKRTVKLVGCSVLNLNFFFMLMLAVFLLPNSSRAFERGDEIVLKNTFYGLPLWDNDRNKKIATIKDGARGMVLDRLEENGSIWYQVKWNFSGVECKPGVNLPCFEGWSLETTDGCEIFGTPEEADRKDAIVETLFWIIPHKDTNHEYNDHGCSPSKQDGYIDGHSGWDVQTHTVVKLKSKDEPFYSLTPGIVIRADEGNLNNTSVIAIYNEACDKTTLYLHAREVDKAIRNSVGKYIDDKTYLGIQGNTGLWPLATAAEREEYENNAEGGAESFREHVHIEVIKGDLRKKEKMRSARGAVDSIDPIPYLYRWVNGDLKAGFLPSDINHDRDVDFFDLIRVIMSVMGKFLHGYDSRCDVNSDGVVDRRDIAEVKEHYGELPPRSPEISTRNPVDGITKRAGQFFIGGTAVSPEIVQQLLEIIREEDDGSMIFKRGIAMLENLLEVMVSEVIIPDKTVLFANYPNPFNPETWIPYHLAKNAEVTVKIYDATGALVRLLDIGYQKAGDYTRREHAAYWDGRTQAGERVASGVYFYTLIAGNYTDTRKMSVLK